MRASIAAYESLKQAKEALSSYLRQTVGRLSIRQRIALLVVALLLPMNVLMVVAIVKLASLSRDVQDSQLRYTASVIANSLEARFERYLGLARALSVSPALLEGDLAAFRAQAASSFPDITDAWPLLSTPDGQEIVNLHPMPSLPHRSPEGLAAQARAFETKSPLIGGVYLGKGTHKWIATIEYPVFLDGKPLYSLSIAMSAEGFLKLLDAQALPPGWIAGIADMQGRYVARSPGGMGIVGETISPGWRATMQKRGTAWFKSREGDLVADANDVSAISGWTVGVAVKDSEFEAPVWKTLRFAIGIGLAVSLLSLALALAVAQHIAGPIRELERKASALIKGQPTVLSDRLPEVERVWHSLVNAVGERHRLETDLKVSEDLLRKAAEGARFGAYDLDFVTNNVQMSPQLRRMLGQPPHHGELAMDAAWSFVHEEDREQARSRASDIVKGRKPHYESEFRIVRTDGEVRWVIDRGQTVISPQSGKPVRATGILIDITERKQAELHQQLLLKELSHRVKNTLAIIQSIAMQTLRTSLDPANFAEVFTARLFALSRAHNLLTQSAWTGAVLDEIIAEAVAPFDSNPGRRAFAVSGTPVQIEANMTIALTLMFHELLTNAAKYGALATPSGNVSIDWHVTGAECDRQVSLHWKESGGPPVSAPARTGFGTRLLQMSAEQLSGKIVFDYQPGGLRCDLTFPLQSAGAHSDGNENYSI